jgi:S1-C subfamily serine protease
MSTIALAVLGLLPGQLPTLDSQDFSREVQHKALTATVRITSKEGIDGSGVLLGQDEPFVYILTANHLVGKSKQADVFVFTADSYPRVAKVFKAAEVVARDARADLAVLRVVTKDALPAPLPLCPASEVPDGKGTVVLTVGCPPKGAPLPLSEVVQAVRLISKPGEEGKARCWETAKGQLAGRSGGPMVDRQGRLLGVASGTSSGKGYYVHIEEIRAFLKQMKGEWPGSGRVEKGRSIFDVLMP